MVPHWIDLFCMQRLVEPSVPSPTRSVALCAGTTKDSGCSP
jgi:hypothetical protein